MPQESDDDPSQSESESESSDSDSENSMDEERVATISKKTLKSAQLENAKLKRELKQLRLAANSKLVEAQNANPRHKPKLIVSEKLAAFDNDIALYGRKYSLTVGPWVDNTIFVNVVGRPNVDPFGDARFDIKDKKAMRSGELAELFDYLPVNLHDPLQSHSKFSRIFRHHLQNTRCNGVLAVRQKAGLIFDFKQEYFESGFDRAQLPEFQRLLKNPPSDEYASLAPILFPNGQYDSTKKTLFRNAALPRIVKTLLCGRSSTLSDKSVSKPQTLAELWGVTGVTPGAIAFSAVLARFMLSPDGELRRIGGRTKISWLQEFLKYKKLLVVKSRRMEDLFKFFDDAVFGSSTKTIVQSTELDNDADELDDAMNAFLNDSYKEDAPSALIGTLTITPPQDDALEPRVSNKPPSATVTLPPGADLEADEEPDVVEIGRVDGRKDVVDVDDTGEDDAQETVVPHAGRKKKGSLAMSVTNDDGVSKGTHKKQSEKPLSKKKKSSTTTGINEIGEGNTQAVDDSTLEKVSKQKRSATPRVVSKSSSATRKSRRGASAVDEDEKTHA